MNVPCRDCTERFVGCHSQCVKYTNYRSVLDSTNQKAALDNICKAYAGANRAKINEAKRKKLDGYNRAC